MHNNHSTIGAEHIHRNEGAETKIYFILIKIPCIVLMVFDSPLCFLSTNNHIFFISIMKHNYFNYKYTKRLQLAKKYHAKALVKEK